MRAVVLEEIGKPLVDADIPAPAPADHEIVIAVRAAGICHSDVHYADEPGRARLPLVLGHEVAGVISATGSAVRNFAAGDRVAVHYLLPTGEMIGKEQNGGYTESIVIPAENAVSVPDGVPFDQAAVMMCSTATAWHSLKVARMREGESVAIIGFGGLGISAIQLARLRGASRVIAVDTVAAKLRMAETMGAIAVDGKRDDITTALSGVDVVLDFATHAPTTLAALRALAFGGRLVFVGINLRRVEIDPYADLLAHERILTGSSDHTKGELVELLEIAGQGRLNLSSAITRTVPLSAASINEVFDDLRRGTHHFRTVITNDSAG